MSVLALCSASGAPGVTTAALALGWVWPVVVPDRRALVVDADPSGSGIVPGYAQAGVPSDGGVQALAASHAPVDAGTLLEHAVALDPQGQRLVLTGITSPAQARTLGALWSRAAEAARDLNRAGVDVVVDLGRLGHRHEPTALLECADVAAVVLCPTLTSVSAAIPAMRELTGTRGPGAGTTAVMVAGEGPYSAREVGRELGVDPLPVLARDPWAARALGEAATSGWRFERSALLRSAATTARHLAGLLPAVKAQV